MNVAALLQDSPSDERRRNSTSGNNQQQSHPNSNPSSRTSASASHNGNSAGFTSSWRRPIEDGPSGNGTNPSGLTKIQNNSQPNQGGAHAHGLATATRQSPIVSSSSSSSSTSPVISRLNVLHRPLSQPSTLPHQSSPSLPPSAALPTVGPRSGVWGPATARPASGSLGPDPRGEQTRMSDSTLPLPRRDSNREMDRERDREKDQPRILNIMDWQGDRDRPKTSEERERLPRRPLLGGEFKLFSSFEFHLMLDSSLCRT
ncbi:hypothetical protein EV361DRAFT_662767 [Lentinula raphanica]|nr:hypothetical protein EV361DRAFT_662767 [Lentinula raphanica]